MNLTDRQIPDSDRLREWAEGLRRLSGRPLELCPKFPVIARRFEAWWRGELLDRPIIMGSGDRSAGKAGARPIRKRLELLGDPDAWIEAKLLDVAQTQFIGDALPAIRADFGPVMLGGLFGGRVEFGSDTTWTHAFIDDDWSNAPNWLIRPDHPWIGQLEALIDRVVEAGRARLVLATPDLGGSADVLLNLRGSEGLCLDVLERPERVKAAVDAIYPAWADVFTRLYERSVPRGLGLVHWLGLWSDQPYVIPACDFNFMISPDVFESLFLPDIARQCEAVGRAVFHLDGPGAARHIEALLEVRALTAVQFTPGEGSPSALAWLEMFRRIQERGRSVLIVAPPGEVQALTRELKPQGLAILMSGGSIGEQAAAYAAARDRFGEVRE